MCWSFFSQSPIFLQSLEFDLIVYAPYRSVEGFAGAMMVSLDPPPPSSEFGNMSFHVF